MKERLDVLMVKRNLAPSREKAKALIMSGNVLVDGEREDKAGAQFDEKVMITIKGNQLRYVSRGGLKLEKAVKVWSLRFDNMICLDIGSSTGGFTDCMLQNGAKKVYAVDSGTNQLCWQLRSDDRVVVMENTNFRYATVDMFEDEMDFASVDVSFISLSRILKPAYDLLKSDGTMVCLIKPQFEAGRENVGKKGVVRDKRIHEQVIENTVAFAKETGFTLIDLDFSPITGPEGNIEYLMYISKATGEAKSFSKDEIKALVEKAFESHGK